MESINILIAPSTLGGHNWRQVQETRNLTHAQIDRCMAAVAERSATLGTNESTTIQVPAAGASDPKPEAKKRRVVASVEMVRVDGEMVLLRKAAPSAKPSAPAVKDANEVPKAERPVKALAFLQSNGPGTARQVAAAIGLTGRFASQQAVAALTSLVKSGKATKVKSAEGTIYQAV